MAWQGTLLAYLRSNYQHDNMADASVILIIYIATSVDNLLT